MNANQFVCEYPTNYSPAEENVTVMVVTKVAQ